MVQEAASLVSAQVELSVLAEQEERLARAELRALRAQISPHFIYNALAAVAGDIHGRPDEARELLIDFAEFTRYLFRDGRSYVTLAEELEHVERYLRLEQARFRDACTSTLDVAPETRGAVVPAMSVQPLVENAVRHGVERRAGTGRMRDRGAGRSAPTSSCASVDDGRGIEPERVPGLLAGAGGGIGLSNVDARLRATFGERYALRIESELGARDHRGHDRPQSRSASEHRLRPLPVGTARLTRMSGDQLTILAVDDERTQLEDLARLLRSSPGVARGRVRLRRPRRPASRPPPRRL